MNAEYTEYGGDFVKGTVILFVAILIIAFFLKRLFRFSKSNRDEGSCFELNEEIFRKFVWSFFKEKVSFIIRSQMVFVTIYLMLGGLYFFPVPYLRTISLILFFIIGFINYVNLSSLTFQLLDDKVIYEKQLVIPWKRAFFVFVYFSLVAIVLSGCIGLFFVFPVTKELSPYSVFMRMAGVFVLIYLLQWIYGRFLMIPYLILEGDSFKDSFQLSLEYTQKDNKIIKRIVESVFVDVLTGVAIVFAGVFFIKGLSLFYLFIGSLLFLIIMPMLFSYFFVMIILLYRIVSSNYYQNPENSNLNEE